MWANVGMFHGVVPPEVAPGPCALVVGISIIEADIESIKSIAIAIAVVLFFSFCIFLFLNFILY
jgi:hypothetical protein